MTARTPDEAPELPAPLGVSPVEAVEIVRKLADDIRRNGMAEEEDARELERTGRKVRGRFSASSARSRSRRLLRRADALDMVARAAAREAELVAALRSVEWSGAGHGGSACPECLADRHFHKQEHNPGCKLARALARLGSATTGEER